MRLVDLVPALSAGRHQQRVVINRIRSWCWCQSRRPFASRCPVCWCAASGRDSSACRPAGARRLTLSLTPIIGHFVDEKRRTLMPMPDSWFPVFTLILGYLAKSLSEWLQHRRTIEREREARDAVRKDLLFERRNTFQRQTLLELQEALKGLVRTAAQMHHNDVMTFRATGEWGKSRLPEDLSDSFRLANANTSALAVRIRDEQVRTQVRDLKSNTSGVAMARDKDSSNQALFGTVESFEGLNERIGQLLRTLDDEPG